MKEKEEDSKIKLSILVPTVEGREAKFNRLMEQISKQLVDGVELLIDKDNKQKSIGKKRQDLLESAKGEYIVFIDDDDRIAEDYIEHILNNTGSDAIGFLIDCFDEGRYTGRAKASNKYSDWGNDQDGFRYVRTIYHKTPIKRELALKAGFKDMRFGEDYDYSVRLKPFIKSEAFINKVMYFYQYEFEDHNTKYGIA